MYLSNIQKSDATQSYSRACDQINQGAGSLSLLNITVSAYVHIVVMNDYEKEFEESKTELEKRLHDAERQATVLEVKLEKTEEAKQEYKKDAHMFESQLEKVQKKL